MYVDEQNAEIKRLSCINREIYALAILTGNKDAPGIVNSLLDALAEKGVLNVLARTALSCGPESAGDMFVKLIYGALEKLAKQEAMKEVATTIAFNAGNPENFRPKTPAHALLLETA